MSPSITIQPPLSRRGHGPGLIILVEAGLNLAKHDKILDPPPAQKWAEEGYAVAQVVVAPGLANIPNDITSAIAQLKALESCDDKDKFGVIAFLADERRVVADALESHSEIKAAVFFNFAQTLSIPTLSHASGADGGGTKPAAPSKTYHYPSAGDFFTIPSHGNFNANAAGLAHTRTLTFLKPILGGPYFDLEAVWEEHTLFEFGERNVDKTMATMVEQPYCTHDKVIDWLLPGVPPTGKHLSIPFTSVVNVRGDHLHHEHIAWDQATALRQLGLLPDYLPFPYQINGSGPSSGKKFEYRLPVAGVESTHKLVDEGAVESNAMFEYGTREVDA
uniref:Lea domain protein n=1 Tax=Colletotrichum fructicola (strain Nara gc5) TaxID=1213859 RepID=L2G9W3_COLFN